jgi:myo-inositol-1(or 4)-monophosphatase
MIRSPLMNVMQAAALKAGKALRKDYAELAALTISRKGPGDFVSEADKRAENILHQELSRARPGYGFLLEERGNIDGADKTHRFIIDPLDGTTNFLHGIPHFAISIGLERDGEMTAGLIYNPMTEEMFIAEKGAGAFVLGVSQRDTGRLRVSTRIDFADSVICCGVPHAGRADPGQFMRELAAVMPRCAGIRRSGSAALDLAYVAAGKYEAFWERNLSSWDIAAGMVIVKEAGGFVTAIDGTDKIESGRSVLACCPGVQTTMIELLNRG